MKLKIGQVWEACCGIAYINGERVILTPENLNWTESLTIKIRSLCPKIGFSGFDVGGLVIANTFPKPLNAIGTTKFYPENLYTSINWRLIGLECSLCHRYFQNAQPDLNGEMVCWICELK